MTEQEQQALLDANSVILNIVKAQALALRVLTDMLAECHIQHPSGSPLTREMLAKRLGLATEALEQMDVGPSVIPTFRMDLFVMRYVSQAMT